MAETLTETVARIVEEQLKPLGAVLADRTVRIIKLENSEFLAETSSPPAPVVPPETPGPVVKDPAPTAGLLRVYIRSRFLALTKANGYADGVVPGESPVGTVVGTALAEWVAYAQSLFTGTNVAGYAALDAAIAADVAKYYPKAIK